MRRSSLVGHSPTRLRQIIRVLFLILIAVLLAGQALRWGTAAAAPPAKKKPKATKEPQGEPKSITAALIDADSSEVGILLESKLLEDGRITWLDRAQIAASLKEQEVQALFGAEQGSDRVELGRLLKADLLILVRAGQNSEDPPKRFVEMVVSETTRGLRLLQRAASLDDSVEQAVDSLAKGVQEALRKYGEQIIEVCAVPPFVSQDLGHAHDYLKGAYAALLEQVLLDQKGVLVVELAEARAIAREAAVAPGGDPLQRRLPLYFLGEYRHEGADENLKVAFELQLLRGQKPLGKTSQKNLDPAAATAKLRELTAKAIGKTIGKTPAVSDPAQEVAVLAARARSFMELGQWEDADGMLEAAILLAPQDVNLRLDAIVTCGRLTKTYWGRETRDATKAAADLSWFYRGLEHLETAVVLGGSPESRGIGTGIAVTFYTDCMNVYEHPAFSAELTALVADAFSHRSQVMGRAIRMRARAKNTVDDFAEALYAGMCFRGDPKYSSQIYDWLYAVIVDLQDLPGAKARTKAYVYQTGLPGGEVGLAFLDRLSRLDNGEVKAAATELRNESNAAFSALANKAAMKNNTSEFQDEPGLLPVRIDPAVSPKDDSIRGCVAGGPGVDLFWDAKHLYLVKNKGDFKPIWSTDDLNTRFTFAAGGASTSFVCFDGRYFWVPAQRANNTPLLLVVDPDTEKVWDVTATAGLPIQESPDQVGGLSIPQFLAVAPVSPGKACVAGWFGQAWLALATISPNGGCNATVFHEARRVLSADNPDDWRRADIAFAPAAMFAIPQGLHPTSSVERHIYIGRETDSRLVGHPLLVDPATQTVATISESMASPELNRMVATRIPQLRGLCI